MLHAGSIKSDSLAGASKVHMTAVFLGLTCGEHLILAYVLDEPEC